MFGTDVLKHCASRQSALVPNVAVKIFDSLCMRAG